jgi:hypothetical protein
LKTSHQSRLAIQHPGQPVVSVENPEHAETVFVKSGTDAGIRGGDVSHNFACSAIEFVERLGSAHPEPALVIFAG